MDFRIIEEEEFERIEKKLNQIYEYITSLGQNEEKLFNSSEVCQLLKVTSRTLQNYRDEGKLKFIQINRKILYKKSDINSFIDQYLSK